jgi:hypothetical protein
MTRTQFRPAQRAELPAWIVSTDQPVRVCRHLEHHKVGDRAANLERSHSEQQGAGDSHRDRSRPGGGPGRVMYPVTITSIRCCPPRRDRRVAM